jgi:cell division protein FtsX
MVEVYLMVTRKNQRVSAALRIIPFAFLLLALPALAADSAATATSSSVQSNSELVQELTAARTTDWNSARDPSVSPVRQGTFLNQMDKADRAIKELEHGFAVSRSEINDALWCPPKHITPQLRAQLIEQLQQAKHQDNVNEQQMLFDSAWGHTAQLDTVTFDQRKQLIDSTIEDLEIGEPVHWSDIRQALTVPASPD